MFFVAIHQSIAAHTREPVLSFEKCGAKIRSICKTSKLSPKKTKKPGENVQRIEKKRIFAPNSNRFYT